MVIILVFGSSIARGGIDKEYGGWVNRLDIDLINREDKSKVYNLGVSGNNSDDLLARIENEIKARKCDIVMIGIGLNDSSYRKSCNGNYVNIEKFKKNLEILKEIVNRFTDRLVFVGLTVVDESKTKPISWNDDAFYTNRSVKKYDTVIEEFCKKNDLLFIPMFDLLDKEDLADGLHPNTTGHKKIYGRAKQALESHSII